MWCSIAAWYTRLVPHNIYTHSHIYNLCMHFGSLATCMVEAHCVLHRYYPHHSMREYFFLFPSMRGQQRCCTGIRQGYPHFQHICVCPHIIHTRVPHQVFRGATSPRRTVWAGGGGGAGASGRFVPRPDGAPPERGGTSVTNAAVTGWQQGGPQSPPNGGARAASGTLRPSTAATYAQVAASLPGEGSGTGLRPPRYSSLLSVGGGVTMPGEDGYGAGRPMPPPVVRRASTMRASAPSLQASDLVEHSASSFPSSYRMQLLPLPQQTQQPPQQPQQPQQLQQPRPARLALTVEYASLPELVVKSPPLSPMAPWRGFSQNPFVAPPPLYSPHP